MQKLFLIKTNKEEEIKEWDKLQAEDNENDWDLKLTKALFINAFLSRNYKHRNKRN